MTSLAPVDDASAEGSFRLISNEDDAVSRIPQVVLQMVADPARFAHAAGGDDDLGGAVDVEPLGLLADWVNFKFGKSSGSSPLLM